MTDFPEAKNGSHALIASMRFPDFEVSWTGPSLKPGAFCLASEDGRMMLADFNGKPITEAHVTLRSKEAINGIAFVGNWMSVSSRDDLILFTLPERSGEAVLATDMPFGAHGVIAGSNGYFYAPVGWKGIVYYKPTLDAEQAVHISGTHDNEVYFYRLCALTDSNGGEILACAVRRNGIASVNVLEEDKKRSLFTRSFEGLDVIDVCPLGESGFEFGAAAASKDGTLIFSRDVTKDTTPATIRYEFIQGTVYRIIVRRGVVFILTSWGLYAITELVSHALNGRRGSPSTPTLAVPMKAIDANLCSDRWLMIVTCDGVLRFDVELFRKFPVEGGVAEARPQPVEGSWETRAVQSERQLVTHSE